MWYITVLLRRDNDRATVVWHSMEGEMPDGGILGISQAYVRQMGKALQKFDAMLRWHRMSRRGTVRQYSGQIRFLFSVFRRRAGYSFETDDYKKFADCFVDYEERNSKRQAAGAGNGHIAKYTVAVAIGDKTKIFQKLASDYGVTATL